MIAITFTNRHAVANAIVKMSSYVVSEKHIEWMEVIPLVNLLRKRNLKNASLHEENPKKISWSCVMNLHGTRLDTLRTKTHPGYVLCLNFLC